MLRLQGPACRGLPIALKRAHICDKYLLLGPISQVNPLRGFTSTAATVSTSSSSSDGGNNNQAPPQPPRSRRWRKFVGGAAIVAFLSWVSSFRKDGKETIAVLNRSLDELDALASPFSRGRLGRLPLQPQAGSSELSTDPTGAHVDVLDEDRTRGKPSADASDDTEEPRGSRIRGREVTRTFEVYHLGSPVHVCVMEPEDRVTDRPAIVINAGTIAAARPLMLALRTRDPSVTVVAYSHSGLLCQHTVLRGLAVALASRAEAEAEREADADDDGNDDDGADGDDDAEHAAESVEAGIGSLTAAVKAGKAAGKARSPAAGDPDIGVTALTACRPPLRPGDRHPTVPLSTLDHESAALAASAMGVTGGIVAAAVAPAVSALPEPLRRPSEAERGLGGKLKAALGISTGSGIGAGLGIGSSGKGKGKGEEKNGNSTDGDSAGSSAADEKERAKRDAENTSSFAPGMPAFNRLSLLLQSAGLEPQPGKWLASYPQPFEVSEDYNPLAPLALAPALSRLIIGDANPLASSFVTPPLVSSTTPASSDYESSELAAVLAGVGLQKAVLVGFHYNWAATVKTALRNAPRIAGLVLVDPLLPPVNPVLGVQMPTETEQLLERASAALAAVEAAKSAQDKGDKEKEAAVDAAWDTMMLQKGLRPSATPFIAQLPVHRNLPPAAAAAWARDILTNVIAGANGRGGGNSGSGNGGGGESIPSLAEALIEHYAAVDPLTSSMPLSGALVLDAAVARSYIVGSGLGPLGTLPAHALLRPVDWKWEKRGDSFGWRRAGTEWRLGSGDTAAALSPTLPLDLLACGSGQTLPFVTSSKASQLTAASMPASPALRKAFLAAVGSGAAGLAHQAMCIALAHVKGESMAHVLVQEREARAAACAAAAEAAAAGESGSDSDSSVLSPFAGVVCDGASTRADSEAAAADVEGWPALKRAFLSSASATSRLFSSPVTADSTDALSSYVPDHGDMGASMQAVPFTVEMDSEAPDAHAEGGGDGSAAAGGSMHDDDESDDEDEDDENAEAKREEKARGRARAKAAKRGTSKSGSSSVAELQAEADAEARARGLRALRNVPLHRIIDDRHSWLDGHLEGLAAENFLHRTIRDISAQMDGKALLGRLDSRAVPAARAAAASVRKEAPRLAGTPFKPAPPVLPPALAESLGNVLTTTLAAFAFPETHFTDAPPLTAASPRDVQKRAKAAAAQRVDGEGNGSAPVPVLLPPAELVPQLRGVRRQAARAVLDLQPQQALALAHAGVALDKMFQGKGTGKGLDNEGTGEGEGEGEGWDAMTAADALSGRLLHAPGAWTLPILRVCLARALVSAVLDAEPLAYKDAAVEAAEAQVLAASDAFIAAASEKRVPVLNASALVAAFNAYEDAGTDDVEEADAGGKLTPGSPAAALAAASRVAAAAPGRRVLAIHAVPSVPAKASLLTRSPGRDASSLLLVNSVEDALIALAARRTGLEPYRAHLEPSNFPVPPQLLTSFAEVVDATASPLQVSTPLRPPRTTKARNSKGRRAIGGAGAGAADTDSSSGSSSSGGSEAESKRYSVSFSWSSGGSGDADSAAKALRQAAEDLDGSNTATAAEAAVSTLVVRRALAGVAAAARELESRGSPEEQEAVASAGGAAGMAEKAKAAFARVQPAPLVRSRGLLAWAATNLAGASAPGTKGSSSGGGSGSVATASGVPAALPFPVQVLLTELPEGRVTSDPVNGPLTLTTGPGGAFVGANDAVSGTVEGDGSTALNGLVGKGKVLVPTTTAAGFQLPQIAPRPPAPVVAVRRALRSHQLALLQSWGTALPPGVVKAVEAESARDCARDLKGVMDRFVELGGVSATADGRILVGGSMQPVGGINALLGGAGSRDPSTQTLPGMISEAVTKRLNGTSATPTSTANPAKLKSHAGEPRVQADARVIPGTHLPVVTGARLSDPLTILADALAYGGPQPYRPALGRLADEVLSMLPPVDNDNADSRDSR